MGLRQAFKALFDRTGFLGSTVSLVDGYGTYGAKPWPFSYDLAMVHGTRSWAYRCIVGNANAAAAVPLRLYVRHRTQLELKRMGYEYGVLAHKTRKVSRATMKRLHGEAGTAPSRAVVRKATSFGDDFEEIVDHPILDLLNKVNPDLNGFDLATGRFAYQQITGNAYIHPVMSLVLHRPTELWPMLPNWTWVIPGKAEHGQEGPTNLIDGYVYGKRQNDQRVFAPDEVLRFNMGLFRDGLYYSVGPTEAAWQVLGTIYSRQVMDKATYDNMARPDWMLVNEQMAPDGADRWKAAIDKQIKGVRKAGGWLALGGKVTATAMNFPPKDLTTSDRYLEEVAGIYGYPITKLLANDPNRANAESGNAGWLADTIVPMLRRDEESLNQGGFLDLFGDGEVAENAVLCYDDPVPGNRDLELREDTGRVAAGISLINEVRERDGLPPVEGGDVPRISGVPLDKVGAAPDPLAGLFGPRPVYSISGGATRADDSPAGVGGIRVDLGGDGKVLGGQDKGVHGDVGGEHDAVVDAAPALADVERKLIPCCPHSVRAKVYGAEGIESVMPDSFKGWVRAKADDTGDADDTVRDGEPQTPIDRMARDLETFFTEQLRIVADTIGRVRSGGARRKAITQRDIDRMAERLNAMVGDLTDTLRGSLADMIQTGGAAGLERIGLDTADPFNVFNPKVSRFLNNYTIRLANDVNTYTVERISATLTEGMEAGETVRELSDRIQREAEVGKVRATNIARTESARAYVEGEQLAWKESGVVAGRKWLLAPDACEFCRAAAAQFNDKVLPLDEPFYKRGAVLEGVDGGTMVLDYSDVNGPPIHPGDRCDVTPVLTEIEA